MGRRLGGGVSGGVHVHHLAQSLLAVGPVGAVLVVVIVAAVLQVLLQTGGSRRLL